MRESRTKGTSSKGLKDQSRGCGASPCQVSACEGTIPCVVYMSTGGRGPSVILTLLPPWLVQDIFYADMSIHAADIMQEILLAYVAQFGPTNHVGLHLP